MISRLQVLFFISLSFLLAVGLLLIILSCALEGVWWPLFIAVLSSLLPLPNLLANRLTNGLSEGSSFSTAVTSNVASESWISARFIEAGYFVTALMIVCSLGLPILFSHSGMITEKSMWMSFLGALAMDSSILLYVKYFHKDLDEVSYFM